MGGSDMTGSTKHGNFKLPRETERIFYASKQTKLRIAIMGAKIAIK